jgi:pimeloyl-ACP methyl ester carboxylesterase
VNLSARIRAPAGARRWFRSVGTACVCAAVAGCASLIAREIANPPRAPQRVEIKRALDRIDARYEYYARDPAPRVAYVVLEPGDYHLRYEFRSGLRYWGYKLDFQAPPRPSQPPRGTVVLLHGWSTDLRTNLHWALALAERGYRCVLVDLRNHGASGNGPAGFGDPEASDIAALIAHLRDQGRVAAPLSLLGASLGAAVAIRVAAADTGIAAVVALEPPTNAAASVRDGFELIAPPSIRPFIPKQRMERAIDLAGARMGVDLRTLEIAPALARVKACIALIHGQLDTVVPVESTRPLIALNPRLQRIELPWDGHFRTIARLDLLADPVADWIAEVGAMPRDDGACPRLVFYALTPTIGVRNRLASPW